MTMNRREAYSRGLQKLAAAQDALQAVSQEQSEAKTQDGPTRGQGQARDPVGGGDRMEGESTQVQSPGGTPRDKDDVSEHVDQAFDVDSADQGPDPSMEARPVALPPMFPDYTSEISPAAQILLKVVPGGRDIFQQHCATGLDTDEAMSEALTEIYSYHLEQLPPPHQHLFQQVAAKAGWEQVSPQPGDPVDPENDQVEGEVPFDGTQQPGTVAETIRPGFGNKTTGKVVPARVTVVGQPQQAQARQPQRKPAGKPQGAKERITSERTEPPGMKKASAEVEELLDAARSTQASVAGVYETFEVSAAAAKLHGVGPYMRKKATELSGLVKAAAVTPDQQKWLDRNEGKKPDPPFGRVIGGGLGAGMALSNMPVVGKGLRGKPMLWHGTTSDAAQSILANKDPSMQGIQQRFAGKARRANSSLLANSVIRSLEQNGLQLSEEAQAELYNRIVPLIQRKDEDAVRELRAEHLRKARSSSRGARAGDRTLAQMLRVKQKEMAGRDVANIASNELGSILRQMGRSEAEIQTVLNRYKGTLENEGRRVYFGYTPSSVVGWGSEGGELAANKTQQRVNERVSARLGKLRKKLQKNPIYQYANAFSGGLPETILEGAEIASFRPDEKLEMTRAEAAKFIREKGARTGHKPLVILGGRVRPVDLDYMRDFPGARSGLAVLPGLKTVLKGVMPNYEPGRDISVATDVAAENIKHVGVINPHTGHYTRIRLTDYKAPKVSLKMRAKAMRRMAVPAAAGLFGVDLLQAAVRGRHTATGNLLAGKELRDKRRQNYELRKQASNLPVRVSDAKRWARAAQAQGTFRGAPMPSARAMAGITAKGFLAAALPAAALSLAGSRVGAKLRESTSKGKTGPVHDTARSAVDITATGIGSSLGAMLGIGTGAAYASSRLFKRPGAVLRGMTKEQLSALRTRLRRIVKMEPRWHGQGEDPASIASAYHRALRKNPIQKSDAGAFDAALAGLGSYIGFSSGASTGAYGVQGRSGVPAEATSPTGAIFFRGKRGKALLEKYPEALNIPDMLLMAGIPVGAVWAMRKYYPGLLATGRQILRQKDLQGGQEKLRTIQRIREEAVRGGTSTPPHVADAIFRFGSKGVRTQKEATKAMRDAALKYHPDRGGSEAIQRKINEAMGQVRESPWFKGLPK